MVSLASGRLGDLSGLVAAAIEAERRSASIRRHVSLCAALQPVFGPASHGPPILLACRELLRNCFVHAYPRDECVRVGVHLWGAEIAAGLVTQLVVADAGLGFDETIPPGGGLARVQAAIRAAGGAFILQSGAGVVCRVTLPFSSAAGPDAMAGDKPFVGAPACR